jgi:hypothetical protein
VGEKQTQPFQLSFNPLGDAGPDYAATGADGIERVAASQQQNLPRVGGKERCCKSGLNLGSFRAVMVLIADRRGGPDGTRFKQRAGDAKRVYNTARFRSQKGNVGLHVSPEGNSQAYRRGCHLRTRQPVANRSLRSSEKHVLRTGRSGLVPRRSTSKIKWSEWIFTAKENGHETAY